MKVNIFATKKRACKFVIINQTLSGLIYFVFPPFILFFCKYVIYNCFCIYHVLFIVSCKNEQNQTNYTTTKKHGNAP